MVPNLQLDRQGALGRAPINGIYTGLLSVGRYSALIWQSLMNAMCWLESSISRGKVIIHPAEPGVLCLLSSPVRAAAIVALATAIVADIGLLFFFLLLLPLLRPFFSFTPSPCLV